MIFCIILVIIVFILMILGIFFAVQEVAYGAIPWLLFAGFLAIFLLFVPFLALDKSSGVTIGTITSVDKNFFGTTAIYIKTSETEQEKYCAEDEEVIEMAKELIGSKVKISYGTRVGLYSLKQCREAPVEKIEKMEEQYGFSSKY